MKTTVAAACAVLALTAGAATAQTVPADRTTYVTFSGPVSVPGTTLPAGTYTFRLLNSDTNRNVVQIFDKDGMKLMTTLLAIPATRDEATGDPIVTFKETPSDRPPAVHYWYYAGDKAGNELVYPKSQAVMIANASGESVMSVDSSGTTFDDMKSGQMSRVTPTTSTTDAAASTTSSATTGTTASTTSSATTTSTDTTTAQPSAAVPPAQPTATSSQTAQSATTTSQTTQPTTTADQPTPPPPAMTATQPTTAPVDQTAQPAAPPPAPTTAPSTPPPAPETVGTSGRSESLPKTASELPLVGLIGLLALGGALAFRAARTA